MGREITQQRGLPSCALLLLLCEMAPKDTQTMEFADVEIVHINSLMAMCRVDNRIVAVPLGRILSGSEVAYTGDRGRLIIGRELALNLQLL